MFFRVSHKRRCFFYRYIRNSYIVDAGGGGSAVMTIKPQMVNNVGVFNQKQGRGGLARNLMVKMKRLFFGKTTGQNSLVRKLQSRAISNRLGKGSRQF